MREEQPFWNMVRKLRQFEGNRCLWRVPAAALLYALPALIFVGATVLAAYVAGDDFGLRSAALAAIVGAAATALAVPHLVRRRLHRKIVAHRLWSFEKPNPATEVHVLVRDADERSARVALRRAKLNPQFYGLTLAQPPPDAPDLDYRLAVQEPEPRAQSKSGEDRIRRIAAVLRTAGVRARVGGVDVLPDDDRQPDSDGRRRRHAHGKTA